MLELKFAIYYRAASLPSQASYAVLAGESQVFFKHSPLTNSIPNSAILRNNYISLLSDLCACVHVKKNGVVKEAIVLSERFESPRVTLNLEKSDGLVHCSVKNAAVLCENHRERVTQIWTNPSEEKQFGRLVTFWFGTFAMHFSAIGCVFRHENTWRWTVECYNGLKVSCFGDFEKFVCISIYCVSALSLHIESTDSMIIINYN